MILVGVALDAVLAFVAAGLWYYLRWLDRTVPHIPLDEEERRWERRPRPITRSELTNFHQVMPGFASTAVMAMTAAYYDPRYWR